MAVYRGKWLGSASQMAVYRGKWLGFASQMAVSAANGG
jgi:hypothetical protein